MGKYVMFAEFNGDELYTPRRSRPLFLQGINPHLKLIINDITTLTFNESNTITGSVQTLSNDLLPSYPVDLIIEFPQDHTETISLTTDSNGTFSTSFTPTERGEYRLYLVTTADGNYSASMSEQKIVLTNSLTTTTTLETSSATIIEGHEVVLTAKVTDSANGVVKGLTVQFYDGNDLLGSSTTNSNGVAVLSLKLNTVKTYSITAQTVGNVMYTTSTSSAVTVTTMKHTLSATLETSSIYIGWSARIKIVDEDYEPVTNMSFVVSINGNNQTLLTNSAGTLTTPVFDATGNHTIVVSKSATTDYNALSSQFSLKVDGLMSIDSSPTSVSNNQTKIPYKTWENLGNTAIANDGLYTVCGTNCTRNMLGGKNGSWNTPAPLKFSNMGLNVPDNANLDSLEVFMIIRTLSCSSDSAKIKISAPTVSIFNNNVLMELPSDSGNLPYKNFGTVKATIDLTNINVNQLNNNSTYFIISFPKNSTTNTGKLQIDHVYVKVNYTPSQEG